MKTTLLSGLLAAAVMTASVPSVLAAPIAPAPEVPESARSDVVSTHWAVDPIQRLVRDGILHTQDGLFAPESAATRGELVEALWRLSGRPVVNFLMQFSDVSQGTDQAEAIRWAASEKLASGYGNGTFGPENPVTRQQLAAILYRYAQKFGMGFHGPWMFSLDFTDAKEIAAWADEPMHWMVANHLMLGKDNCLLPSHPVTRAQEAVILSRFADLAKEKDIDLTQYGRRPDADKPVQMPNPFVDCDTMAKAEALAGFSLTTPEFKNSMVIRAAEHHMIEVLLEEDGAETLRIRKAAGEEDPSGDYSEYEEVRTLELNGHAVTAKGQNGLIQTAVWTEDGYAFAVLAKTPLTEKALTALVAAIH